MIDLLPFPVQIVLLAGLGGLVGSAMNYAIYAWTWFLRRSISPWQATPAGASPRSWLDRIPLLGWVRLRRETKIHGTGFWIRPLLIEVTWIVGLPWFYFWQLGGGLVGGPLVPEPPFWSTLAEVWFWLHAVLLALMFIATFIDFDERTIPDSVTIPGTLFALVMATLFPWSRLPELGSNLAGTVMTPLSFATGAALPLFEIEPQVFARGVTWHHAWIGLAMVLVIFWGWLLALLPKICTLRYGLVKGLWIMIYSCLRPKRKTSCPIRVSQRQPYWVSFLLVILGLVGTLVILWAKQALPEDNWSSLFQAFFGLGFGGAMIWGIRIVGQFALQKEAMGFGDVTLMAMIGAFLGWQVTLLALPIAAILALAVTVGAFVFTRDTQLAFGPYLCIGSTIVLFQWHALWPATESYFVLGEWLFVILGMMLIMMLVMLFGLQLMKRLIGVA